MTAGLRASGLLLACALLGACASPPRPRAEAPAPQPAAEPAPGQARGDGGGKRSPYPPAQEDPSKRGDYVAGGLYAPHVKDTVPDDIPDVDAIPEPEVKRETPSRYGNRSYSVLGKTYRPMASAAGYIEEGVASFYGKKFHGRRTSNQEVYDMYAFSAAHKTLPLPSYVRVTNLANGKSVVVRVNDRGPFHRDRVIDLSYAAAVKLGFVKQGTARVEVRALTPGEDDGPVLAARDDADAPAERPLVADTAVRAAEFERWMQENRIRIAAGPGGTPSTPAAPAPTPAATDAAAAPASATAGATAPTASVAPAGERVLLQLAAYGNRDNAERAQARLREAGIADTRLESGEADGSPIWRLRLGPVPLAELTELSARLAPLGFTPTRVLRD